MHCTGQFLCFRCLVKLKGGGNMIQPIKQNMVFKGTQVPELYQNVAQFQPQPQVQKQPKPEIQTEPEKKENIFKRTKRSFMNFLKGFNNVKNTSSGAIRGAVEGIAIGSLIGVFGYNYKENQGEFFKTLGGTVKDVAGEAWKFIKNIPSAITERSPINTVTTVLKEPFKQMKKLKGNTATIAASIAVALGIVAFRTVQGKIKANRANANIDHNLNEGHVSTK